MIKKEYAELNRPSELIIDKAEYIKRPSELIIDKAEYIKILKEADLLLLLIKKALGKDV